MAVPPPPPYYGQIQLAAPAPAAVAQPLVNPVLVVGPQFVAPYPVDLLLTKKLLTIGGGGTFKVTDVNKNVMFTVKGSMLSFHHNRLLLDATGNPLLTLRQKILSIHNTWRVFRGESSEANNLVATVKRSSIFQLMPTFDVFLASNIAEQVPDFRITGGYRNTGYTIYLANTSIILAQMRREFNNLQSILLDKDNYRVTVSPNVDYAFIVSLILVLHEVNAQSSKG